MLSRSGLIVVVGLVLAGQTKAEDSAHTVLLEDGTFIAHPEASKELARDQLLEKLNEINHSHSGGISDLVADLLYRSDDKENTIVFKDVTVAELIAQNELQSLELGCSLKSLRRRAKLFRRTTPSEFVDDDGDLIFNNTEFAVNVYVMTLLQKTADYCLDRWDDVTAKRIMDTFQLSALFFGLSTDTQRLRIDEKMVAKDILNKDTFRLVKAIEDETY